MNTYAFTVAGTEELDVTITLVYGNETVSAIGFVQNEDGKTVARRTERYSGYCTAEILADMAYEMTATRNGIDWPEIEHGLSYVIGACECE